MHLRTALLGALILPAVASAGGFPRQHSGFLLGPNDEVVDSAATAFAFRLYDTPTAPGQTQIWSASCTLPVKAGYYAVDFASGACTTTTLVATGCPATGCWLEVQVESVTLAPRIKVDAVPLAQDALALAGAERAAFWEETEDLSSGKIGASTLGTLLGNTVNLSGAQTITGAKTFTGGASFGTSAVTFNVAPTFASGASFSTGFASAQPAVIGGATADGSALLDLTSTTKGLLPPRMTEAQRNAIASPAEGLVVFNTTKGRLNLHSGGIWRELVAATGAWGGSANEFTALGGHSYFPLSETSGTSACDVISGGARCVTGTAAIVGVAGHLPRGRQFDSGTDYLRGASTGWLTGNAAHTIIVTFRMNVVQTGTINALASVGWIEGASRNHAVVVNNNNKLGGGYYSDDYWNSLDGTQTPLRTNRWYQAAFTYDAGSTMACHYLDGERVGCAAGATGGVKNFTNDFAIGGWIHTNTASEKPDQLIVGEAALFSSALAPGEVRSIYAGSLGASQRIVR